MSLVPEPLTPAVDTAPAVAAGSRTAADVVEAHLERIDAVNPSLNAITRTMPEVSIAAAAATSAGPRAAPFASTAIRIAYAGGPAWGVAGYCVFSSTGIFPYEAFLFTPV